MWAAVSATISANAAPCSGTAGAAACRYLPNASAPAAVGAANPTSSASHPAMNPIAG